MACRLRLAALSHSILISRSHTHTHTHVLISRSHTRARTHTGLSPWPAARGPARTLSADTERYMRDTERCARLAVVGTIKHSRAGRAFSARRFKAPAAGSKPRPRSVARPPRAPRRPSPRAAPPPGRRGPCRPAVRVLSKGSATAFYRLPQISPPAMNTSVRQPGSVPARE